MFTVLTANPEVHAQKEDEQEALNAAADFVRNNDGALAIVRVGETEEAVAVIYKGWLYVAPVSETAAELQEQENVT